MSREILCALALDRWRRDNAEVGLRWRHGSVRCPDTCDPSGHRSASITASSLISFSCSLCALTMSLIREGLGIASLRYASNGSELQVLRGHEGKVIFAEFSVDEQRIVTASTDGTARIWDAESGVELLRLSGHEGPVCAARCRGPFIAGSVLPA